MGRGDAYCEAYTASSEAMLLSFERPFVGAFAVFIPGAMLRCRDGLASAVLPESDWNMANEQLGSPGTWEVRSFPQRMSGLETPGEQLQALAVHSSVRERTERVNSEVPSNEGNEVRREATEAADR